MRKRRNKDDRERFLKSKKTRAAIAARALEIAAAEGLAALTIGRLAEELKMSKSGLLLPFSTASMNGNFAFTLAGASGTSPLAATGQATLNGTGSLLGNEDINVGGTTASGIALSGTYSMGSNGSGSASVTSNSGTTPLRIDLVSPAEAVFISADPTQPLIGFAEQQCSDCH